MKGTHRIGRVGGITAVLAASLPALGGCRPLAGPVAPAGAAPSVLEIPRLAPAPPTAAAARGALLLREAEACRVRQRAGQIELYVLDEAMRDAGEPAPSPRRDALAASVHRWHVEAVRAYSAFADDPALRDAPERPHALLELGRALREAGEVHAAALRFGELLPLVEGEGGAAAAMALEAHLALADLAFSVEKLDDALTHARKALTLATGARRIKPLYLEAWSLRGLGEAAHPGATRGAMEALRAIVALAAVARGEDVTIVDAAGQELVELYANHGDPAEAGAFFAGAGDGEARRLLAELRERYERRGRRGAEPSAPHRAQ